MGLNINLQKSFAVVGAIVGGIAVLLVLSGLVEPAVGAGRSITENITTADTGSTIGDTMAGVLGPFIPLALIIGLISLAFLAVNFVKSK